MEGGVTITELYIFNQDDKLLTILTPENGLLTAPFRDELNKTSDTPLQFTVDAQAEYSQRHDLRSGMLTQVASSFVGVIDRTTEQDETVNVSPSQFVKEENRVVFKDREGRLREFVIKEIDDINNINGPETTATCIPSFVEELNNKVVVDRRFTDKEVQLAMDSALEGTRFTGVVDVSLGLASTNFYYISSLDAVFKIRETWGGDLQDVVVLSDDETHIKRREMHLVQRLGADNGLRFESDFNIEEIQRTVLSYPYTALYGRGSSLEIQDDEGDLTGGHTRYIDFADVVWKKSNGDPVDKPRGQKWVGDPDALVKYGYKENNKLLHLEGIFSNQDYEDKAELLYATWEYLQKVQHPEINYKLSVDLLDKKAHLGDSAIAIDREFARPIELQSRIIAVEYDLVDIENTTIVEIGQFLDLDDHLQEEVDDLKDRVNRPERPIDEDSFPDVKPAKVENLTATGAFQTIQLHWEYNSSIYIKEYEVYGSQISDFVPDTQHLLYRGKVSAFNHEVATDEKWYYYVRAVNNRGTVGAFSDKAEAETVRIITDDMLFGSVNADILADLAVSKDKIQKLAVENQHIENGAITNLKVGTGAIDTLQVKDGAITNAKINNLNADKIDAGAIRGIDIYGAKFRSSSGNNYMEIVGGDIELTQSNGRHMDIGPSGLYGYNAGGDVRFQADSSLVTSAALGTSNSNVYLAPADWAEARVVKNSSIPGSGDFRDYSYTPIRTLVYRFPDIPNGYFTLYQGGEFRFTGENTENPVYQDLRASIYYGNGFVTRSTNAYIGTDNELRVVNKGLGDIYRDVRANGFIGTSISLSLSYSDATNFYVRPAGNGEVRITSRSGTDNYRPVRASNFHQSSSKELKENITDLEDKALDIINGLKVKEYDLVDNDTKKCEVGVLSEDSPEISTDDEKSVVLNKQVNYNTKAIQEIYKVLETLGGN